MVALKSGKIKGWNHKDWGETVAVDETVGWTLIEAGTVKGRTLTSWPSLKTDIQNAGGSWVDQEAAVARTARP